MPFARIYTTAIKTHSTIVRAAVARPLCVRPRCCTMALLLAFALLLATLCSVGETTDVCHWGQDAYVLECLRKVMYSAENRLDDRIELQLPARSGVKNGVKCTFWKFLLTGVKDFNVLRVTWKKAAITQHPFFKDMYMNMTLEWPKIKLGMNAKVTPCLSKVCSFPLYAQPEISFDLAHFVSEWKMWVSTGQSVQQPLHLKSFIDGFVYLHVDSRSYGDNIRLNPATIVGDEPDHFGPRENTSTKDAVYQAWWDYQHTISYRLQDMMTPWFENHVLPTFVKSVTGRF